MTCSRCCRELNDGEITYYRTQLDIYEVGSPERTLQVSINTMTHKLKQMLVWTHIVTGTTHDFDLIWEDDVITRPYLRVPRAPLSEQPIYYH